MPSKMGESTDCQYSNLDEFLISLVKERPALYDVRVPERERTKSAKQSLWFEISQQMEGHLKPEAAELRWKYLRENFLKARNKLKLKEELAKQGSLSAGRTRKYSFRYYAIMEFLCESLDYQKSLSLNNAVKYKTKLNPQLFHNNQRGQIVKIIPKTSNMNSSVAKPDNLDELDSEMQQNSVGSPFSEEASEYEDSTNVKSSHMSSYDQIFLECLQKPIEKPCPIDGFLIRLGEGLKRLPYKERSKLELEFLTRLRKVEEQLGMHE